MKKEEKVIISEDFTNEDVEYLKKIKDLFNIKIIFLRKIKYDKTHDYLDIVYDDGPKDHGELFCPTFKKGKRFPNIEYNKKYYIK